jgi:hypothetical protein
MQCGRVLFDDFHVEDAQSQNQKFPAECVAGPMSPQEKLLEFMIFDLSSCVTPDIPICTPRTCAQQNIQCGPTGDGCGNVIQCGNCTPPQTCGGGGTPGHCGGNNMCMPASCASQHLNCGPAGDGCGNAIDCGTCMPPNTCGGGGVPGVCGTGGPGTDGGLGNLDGGSGGCVPLTCADQQFTCGLAGDGCGGVINCGACPDNTTCGGAGVPGQCGHGPCTPNTCAMAMANCGPIADGCGGLLQCGSCTAPQICGGSGTPNVCGTRF